MSLPARVDVLVIGAGPTGLCSPSSSRAARCVSSLSTETPVPRSRPRPWVCRRAPSRSIRGSASPRARWRPGCAPAAPIYGSKARAARVPLGDIGRDLSPYPFVLILGQDDNERLLGQALRDEGVEVHWNTDLVALVQSSGEVSVTLKRPDGSLQAIEAGWVAGCDGAHSTVRRLTGVGFPGAPYEHVFFIADTRAQGPMVPGELNVYLWRDGFHLFFPLSGEQHWRVVGILPRELRAREDSVSIAWSRRSEERRDRPSHSPPAVGSRPIGSIIGAPSGSGRAAHSCSAMRRISIARSAPRA